MFKKIIAYPVLITLLSACGGGEDSITPDTTSPEILFGGSGPLPGDPEIIDESTNEPFPSIVRFKLTEGKNEIPFSTEVYDTKRYSFDAISGTNYTIEITNDEASSAEIEASVRTLICPEGASGTQSQTIPRISTRSFDYNASQNCELIIDINGVRDEFHSLFIDLRISVADGLIQDNATYEPNSSLNSAYPIDAGAQYVTTMGQYDDTDYFSLAVTAGQSIDLSIPAHASTNPLTVDVLGENKTILEQGLTSDSNTAISTTINATSTGLMIFRVYQSVEGEPRTYSITATPGG